MGKPAQVFVVLLCLCWVGVFVVLMFEFEAMGCTWGIAVSELGRWFALRRIVECAQV